MQQQLGYHEETCSFVILRNVSQKSLIGVKPAFYKQNKKITDNL